MQRDSFYTVVILTETGWQISRTFARKAPAQKWARWCSATWSAQVYQGGPSSVRVAEYAKR